MGTKFAGAKRINEPIFNVATIYFFTDKDSLISAYKKMNLEQDDLDWFEGCQLNINHTVNDYVKRHVFICVFNNDLSTLMHEINHATFQILGIAGIQIEHYKDGANEAFCYLSQYLFKECSRYMNR